MASLMIGNFGEVFYIDETSEITWDTHGISILHGAPQLDQLTKHLYSYYLLTCVIMLPNSQAKLPPQGVQGPTIH